MKNASEFRKRYKHWKDTGELPYEAGRAISPSNDNAEWVYENSRNLQGNTYVNNSPLPSYVYKEKTVLPSIATRNKLKKPVL